MMPALHNYITVDPTTFLSNPKNMEMIYDMCKTVLTSDTGEDAGGLGGSPAKHSLRFQINVGRLLHKINVRCLKNVDLYELLKMKSEVQLVLHWLCLCGGQVVLMFVELALERLTREVRTSELRTMCLQV